MPPLLSGKSEPFFKLESGPHLHARHSSRTILWGTCAALIPVWIGGLMFFGWDALRIVLVVMISASGFEFLFRTGSRRKPEIQDGSTMLAAILFAFLLPPQTPWWMAVLGSFMTVMVGKEMFGGLGQNLFHPALVGYLTLLVLVPEEMMRRPESALILGGTSRLAILMSGLVLILKRWIPYETPLVYLGAAGLASVSLGGETLGEAWNGSIFLGAFFFATDSVTTPVTKQGRMLFAVTSGVLTALLRFWEQSSQAMAFSILLMNSTTPLLDRFVRPRSKWFPL